MGRFKSSNRQPAENLLRTLRMKPAAQRPECRSAHLIFRSQAHVAQGIAITQFCETYRRGRARVYTPFGSLRLSEKHTSTLVPEFGGRWDIGNEAADNVLSAIALLIITWTLHAIVETLAFRPRSQASIDGLMTFFLLRSQGNWDWFHTASHPLPYAKGSVLSNRSLYSEHRLARWRVVKSVLIRFALVLIEFAAILVALPTTKAISVSGKGIRMMGAGAPVHFRGLTFGFMNVQRVPRGAESDSRLAYCLTEDRPVSARFDPSPRVNYKFTYDYFSGQVKISLDNDELEKHAFLTYFFENSERRRLNIPMFGHYVSSLNEREIMFGKAIERSFMKHVKLYHKVNETMFTEGLGGQSGLIGSITYNVYGPIMSNITEDWMIKEIIALARTTYVSQMLDDSDDLIEGTGAVVLKKLVLFRIKRPILSVGGLFLMLGVFVILHQVFQYCWPLDYLELCFTALKEVLGMCCISGPADRALEGHVRVRWSAEPLAGNEDIGDYRRGHMGLVVPSGFIERPFYPTVKYS